jgi:hypothetical protein
MERTIPVPRGWIADSMEVEALCPEHAKVAKFRECQCAGCTFTFGEGCPAFQLFAFTKSPGLTPRQEAAFRMGNCPVRQARNEGDTGDPDPVGGKVFAAAALAYCEVYGKPARKIL